MNKGSFKSCPHTRGDPSKILEELGSDYHLDIASVSSAAGYDYRIGSHEKVMRSFPHTRG